MGSRRNHCFLLAVVLKDAHGQQVLPICWQDSCDSDRKIHRRSMEVRASPGEGGHSVCGVCVICGMCVWCVCGECVRCVCVCGMCVVLVCVQYVCGERV